MASLGHLVVAAAARRAWPGGALRSLIGLSALSLAPDLDVVGFRLGIPYDAPWGHRGATHSIVAALVGAAVATLLLRPGRQWPLIACLAAGVALSHGLLDAMTDGGRGVAFFWPWTSDRYFLPWRPIPVAPIGARLVSERGLHVLVWESVAFAPAWVIAVWPRRRPPA